ncbi:MAG TPA: T9SS type A sorting domain-containing protein [Cytophagaceae bacterium]
MQLRVVEFASSGYYDNDKKKQSVFSVYHQGRNINSNGCYVYNAVNNRWGVEVYLFDIQIDATDTEIPFTLITHNERKNGSEPCTSEAVSDINSNFPDAYEVSQDHVIRGIKDKQPGLWHYADEFKNGTDPWSSIKIQYKYDIPKPEPITFHNANKTCADDTVHFSTDLKNILGGADKLKYNWEYWLGDYKEELNPEYMSCINSCSGKPESCYLACEKYYNKVQVENWLRVSDVKNTYGNGSQHIYFVPKDFHNWDEDGNNKGLTENTNIKFRVSVAAEYEKGVTSSIFNYTVQPARPRIDPKNITSTPTCAENGTAVINLSGVESLTPNYRYSLIKGIPNDTQCNIELMAKDPASCFGDKLVESGLTSNKNISIAKVAYNPDGYSIRLTNVGDKYGVCFKDYPVPTINKYDPVLGLTTKKDVSCHGKGDGEINFASSGGIGITTFSLSKDNVILKTNAAAGVVDNLQAGLYTIDVNNVCANVKSFVTIIEPSRVSAEVTTNNPTCINPSNGQLLLKASQGSERFNYALYKMNSVTDSTLISQTADHGQTWQLNDLSASAYHVIIKDAQRDLCPGAMNNFTIINPPNLSITDLQKKEVECAGASTGGITIKSTGGIGKYIYQIKRSPETNPIENTTGTFENLYSGTYSAVLKSGVEGCLDSYNYPSTIAISQPSPIEISYVKSDITCYEDANGSITASVKGGKGGFSFAWEKKINADWNTYPGSGLEQKNLLPGEYRLKVTDLALCNNVSSPVEVIEPELLAISDVEQLRPDCKGETVKFTPKVSGGSLPYQLLYSTNDGISYEPFEPSTTLYLGSYKIRATDKNNCVANWNETIKVALNNLVVEKSVTPVCYKSTNGSISLKPKGGNPPYSFSKDDGQTFQPSGDFFSLPAGTYPINVKDNFGCSSSFSLEVVQKLDKPEINFMVASRDNALDTLIIPEVSRPKPDSLFWTFDPAAIVIDTNKAMPEIRFNQEGKYKIAMTGYFGGCVYTLEKEVDVKPFDPGKGEPLLPGYRPIDQVQVTPNPNDGFFNLKVKLIKKQQLVAIIIDLLGNEQYKKFWDYIDEVDERIEIPEIPSGSYLIRLITDNDAREVKIIVRK